MYNVPKCRLNANNFLHCQWHEVDSPCLRLNLLTLLHCTVYKLVHNPPYRVVLRNGAVRPSVCSTVRLTLRPVCGHNSRTVLGTSNLAEYNIIPRACETNTPFSDRKVTGQGQRTRSYWIFIQGQAEFSNLQHDARRTSTASEGTVRRFQAERMPSCWHNFAPVTVTYYGHTDTSSTLWSIRHARSVAKASIPWNTGSRNVLHWQLPGYISLCIFEPALSLKPAKSVVLAKKCLSRLWRVCRAQQQRHQSAGRRPVDAPGARVRSSEAATLAMCPNSTRRRCDGLVHLIKRLKDVSAYGYAEIYVLYLGLWLQCYITDFTLLTYFRSFFLSYLLSFLTYLLLLTYLLSFFLSVLLTYLLSFFRSFFLSYLLTYLLTFFLSVLLTYFLSFFLSYLLTYLLSFFLSVCLTYLLTFFRSFFLSILLTYLLTYGVAQTCSRWQWTPTLAQSNKLRSLSSLVLTGGPESWRRRSCRGKTEVRWRRPPCWCVTDEATWRDRHIHRRDELARRS